MKRILLLPFLLVSLCAYSGVEVSGNRISGSQVQVNATVLAKDNKFPNVSVPGVHDVKESKTSLLLGMDQASTLFTSYYKVTMQVEATLDNNVAPEPAITLEITFDPAQGTTYKDKHLYRFPQTAHRIKAKILSIDARDQGNNPIAVPGNIFLETIVETERYYDFAFTSIPAIASLSHRSIDTDGTAGTAEEVEIFWNYMQGAEEYDLEWAYVNNIDDTDGDGFIDPITNLANLKIDFRFSNTRVRVTGNAYRIPLLFESGYIVYRVRGVGRDISDPKNKIIAGRWSSEAYTSVQTVADMPDHRYEIIGGHEKNKNWQYTSNFAEEGKKKEAISYFDGSLRNREVVSRINTQGQAIIGQTIYDHQGRGAIQVLPTPVQGETFKYYEEFNKNNVINNSQEYSRLDFDKDKTACNASPDEMGTQSGSSRYYSIANLDQNGVQAYVPDAQKYPFTQIEYTPDNTGRIRRQSGVGVDHILGSTHETKYFYGTPFQEQVDRLFGSEVGYAVHYKKNMVIDANGQVSVSYLDQQGRVIATSLAGESPANLNALASNTGPVMVTGDLLRSNAINPHTNSIEAINTLLVSSAGPHLFHYEMTTEIFNDLLCMGNNVCYDCVYDLTISVKDDCGNELMPGGQPFTQTIGQSNPLNTDCDLPLNFIMMNPADPVEINLQLGNYTVTKTLHVNEAATNFYTEKYIEQNKCLKTLKDFERDEIGKIDLSECYPDCDECLQALGPYTAHNDPNKADPGHASYDPDYLFLTQQEYDEQLASCKENCEDINVCEAFYQAMLADMKPGGQYAQFLFRQPNGTMIKDYEIDNLSVLNAAPLTLPYGLGKNYTFDGTTSDIYFEDDGVTPSLVNINGVDKKPQELTRDEFVDNFRDSWAKKLVELHPEYCYYQWCQKNDELDGFTRSSNTFDQQLLETDTYAEAIAKKLLNPLGLPNDGGAPSTLPAPDDSWKDPYFQAGGEGVSQFSAIATIMDQYQNSSDYSMWEMAVLSTICKNSTDPAGCLSTNAFGTCDRDAMWIAFRSFYISEKQKLQDTKRITAAGCTTVPVFFGSENRVEFCIGKPANFAECGSTSWGTKARRFPSQETVLGQWTGQTPSQLQTTALQGIAQSCNDQCNAYADTWMLKLAGCQGSNDSQLFDDLRAKLIEICKLGCDKDNPFGSSTVPPGNPGTNPEGYKSFEEAIKGVLGVNAYSKDCTQDLLGMPMPYGHNYFGDAGTRPLDTCACSKILNNATNFASNPPPPGVCTEPQLFKHTYGIDLEENYSTFKTECQAALFTCNGNTNWPASWCAAAVAPLSTAQAPAELTCPKCLPCSEVEAAYLTFTNTYTLTSTTEHDRLLVAYLNRNLNMNLGLAEYLDFLQSCPGSTISIPVCNAPTAAADDFIKLMNLLLRENKFIGTVNLLNPPFNTVFAQSLRDVFNPNGLAGAYTWTGTTTTGSFSFVSDDETSSSSCLFSLPGGIDFALVKSIGNMKPYSIPCGSSPYGITSCFSADILLSNGTVIISDFDIGCIPISTCTVPCADKVVNGNFSDGNTGFGSAYSQNNTNTAMDFQQYSIRKDARTADALRLEGFGHNIAGGGDNFLLLHRGSTDGVPHAAWTQTLSVQPSTDYSFAVYANHLLKTNLGFVPSPTAKVDLIVNGSTLTTYTVNQKPDEWVRIGAQWSSGTSTQAQLEISVTMYYNTDFQTMALGIDDISFIPTTCAKVLCNRSMNPTIPPPPECEEEKIKTAKYNARKLYQTYLDSIKGIFLDGYTKKCLEALKTEIFTVTYPESEYHFTLYYYDQAGNLVRTVPPAGVVPIVDPLVLASVKDDRKNGTHTVFTNHTLFTTYEYNSLNQLIRQSVPDNDIVGKWASQVFSSGLVTGNATLSSIFFTDTYTGYALTSGGSVAKTTDGGATWVLVRDNTLVDEIYNKLVFVSPDIGIAIGEGIIVRTDDAGATWNTLISPAEMLHDIHFISSTTGFIVGDAGIVLKTTNSGASWTILASPAASENLLSVYFTDENNGYAGGGQGAIYTTSNGGTSWNNTVSLNAAVNGLHFTAVQTGYGVTNGGGIFITSDGGLNWAAQTSGTTNDLMDVAFTSSDMGYVVGKGGVVLRTENGGTNWIAESVPVQDYYSVNTFNKENIYISGTNATVIAAKDGRASSRFYYDRLGRLVVSQNAKQFKKSVDNFTYSYTLYDPLGRISEVGENHATASIEAQYANNQLVDANFNTWITNGTKTEKTHTLYDASSCNVTGFTQDNLRNRVSCVYIDMDGNEQFEHATHYTYDIHGNVSSLLQDNALLASLGNTGTLADQRYKKTDYEYDLVSGNVNAVHYQNNQADAFHHAYEYDADNRITNVYTSNYSSPVLRPSSLTYDQDAKYFYYQHTPLARTEIGDLKVQAMDYAYTLQGWVKGINSNTLNEGRDIGKDGNLVSSNLNKLVTRDAYGYSLGYFHDDPLTTSHTEVDYQSIGGTDNFIADVTGSAFDAAGPGLFNGNIRHMVTALTKPDGTMLDVQGAAYKYDQLNRIKEMNAFTTTGNDIVSSNDWGNIANTSNAYKTAVSYDANGNIVTMLRNGEKNNPGMDDLTYVYENKANAYSRNTNRLRYVLENATSSYSTDIDGQNVNNYMYDEIGSLVSDEQEEIDNIEWTMYGKVKKVARVSGSNKVDLEFLYDASGNRIAKIVKPRSGGNPSTQEQWEFTYYVRDASGNVMATYKRKMDPIQSSGPNTIWGDVISMQEQYIYGNSRIGLRNENKKLAGKEYITPFTFNGNGELTNTPIGDITIDEEPANDFFHTLAKKNYEMSSYLGNVLVVVSDKRIPVQDQQNTTQIAYYKADVISSTDYGVWGDPMPMRSLSSESYKYGFGGKEKTDEWSGSGNNYDFGLRIYDPRLGRWLTVDPEWKVFPAQSPYNYALNNPILLYDDEGDIPVLKWVIDFGAGVATDVFVQMAAAYIFGDATNVNEAWAEVSMLQALRSGGENLIKNKTYAAIISGTGDVIEYVNKTANPTLEGAMQKFILGVGSAYLGDIVAKYGVKKVAKGLEKMGLDQASINKALGIEPPDVAKTEKALDMDKAGKSTVNSNSKAQTSSDKAPEGGTNTVTNPAKQPAAETGGKKKVDAQTPGIPKKANLGVVGNFEGSQFILRGKDGSSYMFSVPQGIPKNWLVEKNDIGSIMFVNPANRNDWVRVSAGNKNANPAQHNPYVKRSDKGKIVDKSGNQTKSDLPESHIPASEFKF